MSEAVVEIELSPEAIKSVVPEGSLDRVETMPSPSPANEAEVQHTGRSATVTDDEEGWQEAVPRARSFGANKRRPAHGYSGQDVSQKGPSNYHRSRGTGNAGGGDYSRVGRGGAGSKGNNHSTESQQPHSGNAGKSSRGEMSGAARRTPAAPSQGVTSTKTAPVQVTSSVVQESTLDKKANENDNSEAVVAQLPAPVVRQPSIKFSKTGVPGKGSFSYKEVALTSPGSMLQFRSALEASSVPDRPQQSEVAAAVPVEDVKSVEVTPVEATPVEAASVEASPVVGPLVEEEDHKKDVIEMTSSNALPIPSSAEVGPEEAEPEERIIETVEPSPPAQSVETPLQGSSELSNGSVPIECENLDCRAVEEQKSVFVTNASDGGSEGNAKVDSGVNDRTAPGSDDDSAAAAAAAKRLSAAAPPFNPNDVLPLKVSLPVPRTVAVTPFKDGRSPPVGGLRPQISFLPVTVPATVAITPICKVTHPTLAPLPPSLYPFQYEPYMGVMHGILPPFQSLPQAPLDEGHPPPRKVPSPVMMGTKKMNPDAEEFIPSYLRDSPKLPTQSVVTTTENLLAVEPLERRDLADSIDILPAPAGDGNVNVAEVDVQTHGAETNQLQANMHDVDDKSSVNSLPSHIELKNGTPVVEVKCVTVQ